MANSNHKIWVLFSPSLNLGKWLIQGLAGSWKRLFSFISKTDLSHPGQSKTNGLIKVEVLEDRYTPAASFWPDIHPATGGSPTAMVAADFNGDGKPDFAACSTKSITLGFGLGNGSFDAARILSIPDTPKGITTGDFNGDGKPDIATANDQSDSVSILLGNGDWTFKAPFSFSVGSNPYGLSTGDFNGDGKTDIATANFGNDTLSIALGNGNGTFQTPTAMGVGTFPYAVTVVDFNGDGKLDLASANNNGSSVTVLLGNGNGSFKAGTTTSVGPAPQSIVWSDFNKDGKTDIATANYSGGSVSILLGNGNGTFRTASQLPVGQGPQIVAVSDFNNDGKTDLITANVFDNSLSILAGNGDGSFKPSSDIPVGMGPQGLVAADFSGDGKIDLLSANTTDNTVTSLLGNGNGTFKLAQTLQVGGNPYSVEVADFNGDGKDDLISANANGTGISLMPGNGNGSFGAAQVIETGANPQGLTIGDFNKDGKQDLAVANFGSNTLSVNLGNGNGSFKKGIPYPVGNNPFAVTQGDVNGDGLIDLLAINNGDSTVSILLGNADGSFTVSGITGVGANPQAVLLGDFNRDGKLDIATANTGESTLSVVMGNGDGTFQPGTSYIVGASPFDIAQGDFNGDGFADLICTNTGDNTVSLLPGMGDGTFGWNVPFPVGLSPFGLRTGDFNKDGALDIVTADSSSNGSTILLSNGNGSFQPGVSYTAGTNPSDVAIGDFNGDGSLDVATANNAGGQISVLLGNGDGQLRAGTSIGVGMNPGFITQGDFNGDSKPDLVTVNSNSGSLTVLFGNGNGTYQPGQEIVVGSFPQAAAIGDFNGDGRLDLVTTNNGDDSLSMVFGNGNGTFKDPVRISAGSAPQAISSFDFNGDKKTDLVVTNNGDNTVSVFLGNGNGTFKAAKNFSVGIVPQALTVADFNGDGKTDIVTANSGGNSFSLLPGNGDGTFKGRTDIATGPTPYGVTSGDFNGDGKQDIVTANAGGNGVSLLIGNGNGTFKPAKNLVTGSSPFAVIAADFNTDGQLDLATANSGDNSLSLLYGNGDGNFQNPVQSGVGSSPYSLIAGDWNSDGSLDLATANFMGNSVSVLQSVTPQSPLITSSPNGTLLVGNPSAFRFTATGSPAPGFSLSGGTLPLGLTFNSRTGQIAGNPVSGSAGQYTFTLTANNGIGNPANQAFTLSITESLGFTSPAATTMEYGKPVNFQVKATGFPAPTFSISSGTLPLGITFNPTTGLLSGKTNSGNYSFQISASNGTGPAITQNFSLTITKAALTISVDIKSKVYGAVMPNLTTTFSGLVNGETSAVVSGLLISTTGSNLSTVGTYPITATGGVASNYSITYLPGTLTITQAALTITPDPKTKAYGGAMPTLTASFSGLVNGDNFLVVNGLTLSTTAKASSDAGQYKITASGATATNYTISYGPDAVLQVTRASLTIAVQNKSKIYGAPLPSLDASLTGLVNGDSATIVGGMILSTSALATSKTGDYPITASGAVASNYNITYVPGTLSVTRANLIITADAKTKTYGQAVPALTATFSGLVNGDTSATFSGITLSTVATGASPVGSYSIQVSGASSANYSIQMVNSTLTVDKAELTIAVENKTKVYGGAMPSFTATYTGLVNGETPGILSGLVLSSTGLANSKVGNYPIIASGAVSPNYAITYVSANLTITPATLIITPDNKTAVYGGTMPNLTATIAGLVNGDTAQVVNGLTLSTTATKTSNTGTYKITSTGASSPNYTISYGPDSEFKITPATLTISVLNTTKVYGAPLPKLEATFSGLVNGDNSSVISGLTIGTLGLANSNVGIYPVNASGAVALNYQITYIQGILTVTRANLTIAADPKTRTFGQPQPDLTVAFSGLVNGDTPDIISGLKLSTKSTANSPVGIYPIQVSSAPSTNYAIQYIDSNLTITKAALTITPDAKTKTYGDILPIFTATITGLVNGDTPSVVNGLELSTTALDASPAGTYPISFNGTPSADNYTITLGASSQLTVAKARLTISAENKSMDFGQPLPELTASYQGLVNGDTASAITGLQLITPAQSNSKTGTYPIFAAGANSQNYSIVLIDGTLTVSKAHLVVTAVNRTVKYGDPLPNFEAVITGFLDGDNPSMVSGLSFQTLAKTGSDVGDYLIVPGNAGALNYGFVYVPGTLSITKANLVITPEKKTKTYGAPLPELTALYQGLVNGDTPSVVTDLVLRTTAESQSKVGQYTIDLKDAKAKNYNITIGSPAPFDIIPAQLNLLPVSKTKVYGEPLPQYAAIFQGLVNGDDPSAISGLNFTTTAMATSGVGSYPIRATSSGSANYDITYQEGTLQVLPASLVITASNQTKTYGEALPGLSVNYAGFVNGDGPEQILDLAISSIASPGSPVGQYPIKVSQAHSPNYQIRFVDGSLSITKALLIISAEDKTTIYGSQLPQFTADLKGLVNGEGQEVISGLAFSSTASQFSGVGTYTIKPMGAFSLNYQIQYLPGTLQINPADLLISPVSKSKSYGQSLPALEATFTGLVNGDGSDAVQGLTLNTDAKPQSPVGTYSITAFGGHSPNYQIRYGQPATLIVTRAPLTVQAINAAKHYGEPLPDFQASLVGLVNGDGPDSLSGLTFKTQATPMSPVGVYNVTPSGAFTANYEITYLDGNLSVNKANLKIRPKDASKIYGQPVPVLPFEMIGLVSGDGPDVVSGLKVSTTARSFDSVGNYPITVSGGISPNYQLQYESGILTIDQALLTIHPDNKNKPFGAAIPSLTATIDGLINGDEPSVVSGLIISTTAQSTSPAGDYPINGSSATAANYKILYQPGILTVDRTLSITSSERAMFTYGQSGKVNFSASAPAIFQIPSNQLPVGVTLDSGNGQLNLSGQTPAGNYVFNLIATSGIGGSQTEQSFTLTIAKARLSITANNQEKRYGQPVPRLDISVDGLVNGDQQDVVSNLLINTVAGQNSPVGSFPINLSGGSASNYDLSLNPGQLRIERAPLTIQANDRSIRYGSQVPELTATFSGLVAGDHPSNINGLLLSTTAKSNSPVGLYQISASGGIATNYDITLVPGTLSVEKAPLTITPENKTKMAGAAIPNLSATYSGLVNGDTPGVVNGLSLMTTALANSPIGEYPILASQASATNYAIQYVKGTLSVVDATRINSPNSVTFTYGKPQTFPILTNGFPAPTFRVVDGVMPPGITLESTTGLLSSSGVTPAGIYKFTVGSTNGVGKEAAQPFTLTVSKAKLMISPVSMTRPYGVPNSAVTAEYAGLVNGDTAAVISGLKFATTASYQSKVGTYPITASGATAANYSIQFGQGTLTVAKAKLKIILGNASKVYGTALPALNASFQGLVNGDTSNVITGLKITSEATASSPVGNYSINGSGATAANYSFEYIPATMTVTRASLNITPTSAVKVYGAQVPTLSATFKGLVNGDTEKVINGLELKTTATSGSQVGTYPITAGSATAANYAIQFSPGILTVTKATLTIKPNDKTKTYGSAVPALDATISGWVNGDTEAAIKGLSLTTTANSTSPVGNYPISAAKAVSTNYNIVYATGSLSVTRAALLVQADNLSKVYGSSNPGLTFNITGLLNGDKPSVLTGLSLVTTAKTGSPVGSYPIIPSQASAANYTITYANGSLTILPATLTINPENKTKAYGSPLPVLSSISSGLVNGDTLAVLTGLKLATGANASSPAGTYPITATGGTAQNYVIRYGTATLTITKAQLAIRPDDKTKTYGDENPILTATFSGLTNGDSPAAISNLKLSTTATKAVGAGNYAITASGATSDNYSIQFLSGTMVVKKAELVLFAQSQFIPLGANLPNLSVSYKGLVNSDSSKAVTGLKIGTAAQAKSPVGNYPITVSGGTAANYYLTYVSGTLSIGVAPSLVTPNTASFGYGQGGTIALKANGTQNSTFALTTPIEGISLDQTTGQLSVPASVPAGIYSLALQVNNSFGQSSQVFTLRIQKAKLTIQADDKAMVYGSPLPDLTTRATGLVNGDPVSVISGLVVQSNGSSKSNVGDYPIIPSGAIAANYDITFLPGKLSINKAHLNLSADNQEIVYGNDLPKLTTSVSGFVNGDDLSVLNGFQVISSSSGKSDAGIYPITVAASARNYQIDLIPGSLTILKAGLLIQPDDQSMVYGSPLPDLTVKVTGLVHGDSLAVLSGLIVGTEGKSNSDVGQYKIIASGASAANYEITFVPGSLWISKARLSIIADNQQSVYGNPLPTPTAQISGFVNGDDASSLVGFQITRNANSQSGAGTYPISVSASAKNYQIDLTPGMLTILKANLIIQPEDQEMIYGSAIPELKAKFEGLVNGDTFSEVSGLVLQVAATSKSDVGDYLIIASGAMAANYDIRFIPGKLSIGKAHLSIEADNQVIVYGNPLPILTTRISGWVNGDGESAISGFQVNTTAAKQSGVGSYPISLTASAKNYQIDLIPGTLTIRPASLRIVVDKLTKVYGTEVPPLTAQYQGLAQWDDSSVVNGLTLTSPVSKSSSVGTYSIRATGAKAENYNIELVQGYLQVTRAPLLINPDPKTRLVGGSLPKLTATINGLVNGDPQTVVTGLLLDSPVMLTTRTGIYTITATGARAANYEITYGRGTFTVGSLPTITSAAKTESTYGQVATFAIKTTGFPAPSYRIIQGELPNGLVLNQQTGSLLAQANLPAGVYSFRIGATNGFGNEVVQDFSWTVKKADLTIRPENLSRAYGATNPTLTATFSGLVAGDTPDSISGMSLLTSANQKSPVGVYPIVISGAASPNYNIRLENGTLSVTKAQLMIRPNHISKPYGAENPKLSASYFGLVNNETFTVISGLNLVTNATRQSVVGNYTIEASGASSSNYEIRFESGFLTVEKAVLTITANDQTRFVNSANPPLTATMTGLVNGDSAQVVTGLLFSTPANRDSTAGVYPIRVESASATNYSFLFFAGKITVTQPPGNLGG